MAEPATLGDFFKKNKKKIKGSNLNTLPAAKAEVKKTKAKDAEEEAWAAEEEVVAASGLKVEAAGKLPRDDEKKEEEDATAPKWGRTNKVEMAQKHGADLSDRKYPSLAKSVMGVSSNITIDNGSSGQVNITTHKNVFSALENEDADEDDYKKPGKIMPAMVQKKKGETSKAAIEREVQKYKGSSKEDGKKSKASKADKDEDEDEDEDEEEEEEEEKPEEKPVEEVKKKKEEKKPEKKVKAAEPKPETTQDDEDTRIQPDLAACKAKYAKRRKLPHKALPKSELEEEKENKPKPSIGGKKKKGRNIEDEEVEKKLAYADF